MTTESDQKKTMGEMAAVSGIMALSEVIVSANADVMLVYETAREWKGKGAKPKNNPTNEEIIGYLAEGGRDITPNEAEIREAGEIMVAEYAKAFSRIGKEGERKFKDANGIMQIRKTVVTREKGTKSGTQRGLRRAMDHFKKKMVERIKSGTDNKGAKKIVTKRYARRRHLQYDVADDRSLIFHASLQLSNAVVKSNVKIKMKNANLEGIATGLGFGL